jgi:hypothetical protein
MARKMSAQESVDTSSDTSVICALALQNAFTSSNARWYWFNT